MADTGNALTEFLKSVIRPGGEPLMGRVLAVQQGIGDLSNKELGELIRKELGFERENQLIEKKISAAIAPVAYFDKRKDRQEKLSEKIAEFIKDFTKDLGKAGFTADEIGIIARHIANELGNIMSITVEAEYPMEFARKSIEDLLKKKYK